MKIFSTKKNIIIVSVIASVILAASVTLIAVQSHDCDQHYKLISTRDATCIQEGVEVYQCEKCERTKEVVLSKAAHSYVLISSSKASCIENGMDIFSCSVCSDTYKKITETALGHDHIVVSETEASCMVKGFKIYSCSRCEDSYTEETGGATGHNYNKIVDDPATCTDRGIRVFVCSNCQDSYTEHDNALQHDYQLTETVSATCTTEGSDKYICSRCNDESINTVSKLPHDYVEVSKIAPTCTASGTVYYKCSQCPDGKTDTIAPLNHNYSDLEVIASATCTQTGLNMYHCTRDGCSESYTEITPKISHIPSGNATIYDACVCTMCKTTLQPKLDHELGINYNYGYASDYHTTAVNTQDRTGYDLGYYDYYSTAVPLPGSAITFNESMSLQDFYTHNLLTAKTATTNNGKHFYVDGGFKVSFAFQTLADQLYDDGGMNIIKFSDFTDQFENDSILKLVKEGKSSDKFYTIYQVVDFAYSSIEISRLIDGEYVTVATVSTVDDWNSILNIDDIILSDKDGKMFSDAGTYRVMFKFSIAWFIESSNGKIYNVSGEECYPYGIVNDQYDYFYVTVTDETYNTLLPDDLDETKDMFYQISMDDIQNGLPYIKSGEAVDVADDIDLIFDSKIGYWEDKAHYQGKILTEWSMDFCLYDAVTDTYVKNSSYNLLDCLTTLGTGKVKISKSFQTGYCKIEIHYTFKDTVTAEETSYTDVYYLYIS